MLSFVLSAALAQAISFQVRTFQPDFSDGGETGELTADELNCVQSVLPLFHSVESEDDFLGVRYVRNDTNRSQACVSWSVERSEPIDQFVLRTRDTTPSGVRYSPDGAMAYWVHRHDPVCIPAGNLTFLRSCLSDSRWGITAPGRITSFDIRRSDTGQPAYVTSVWELITAPPIVYGIARAEGVAKSHVHEQPPIPEE
jgi:hypothetical protein